MNIMAIRKVLVAILGHVDHGKTTLLDRIRQTAVAKSEAGAITQAIGVSIIPLSAIKKICGKLLDIFKGKLTVPGMLAIDTPGHASFASLRKRGGSLADLAILVVDINEGLKPQTIESMEILKANKVPFIIAANKIDLINEWKYDHSKFLLDNINTMDFSIQGTFEKKLYDLVAQIQEHGFPAERFDRVDDYTKQVAIIPLSAKSGQGIPELLMVLTGLAQKFLEKKLEIEEKSQAKGTILEVKEEKGLGTTLDVIIYNGTLKVNDLIVIGGIDKPIVTKVRALLEPVELMEMREKKSKFKNVSEVTAATGVKIAAPELNQAIAGMPLRSSSLSNLEQTKAEVQQEVGEVLIQNSAEEGIILKADTIGGLEALQHLLQEKNIPIASSLLGDITKKDLSQVESMKEKNEFYAVLIGFNVKLLPELEEYAQSKNIKLIINDVIYKIMEDYQAFILQLKKDMELRQLTTIVRPCKFQVLKGYVFRQSHPAIVGVEIEAGSIRTGDPIMNKSGKRISAVKSLQEGQEALTKAEQGKQLALAMDGITIGRQVNEGDFLYTDVPEDDFKKLKALKKYLSKKEAEVLREIVEIKRAENPVWGVG